MAADPNPTTGTRFAGVFEMIGWRDGGIGEDRTIKTDDEALSGDEMVFRAISMKRGENPIVPVSIIVQEETGQFPGAVVILRFAEGKKRAMVRSEFTLDLFLCSGGRTDFDERIDQANAYATALGKILGLPVETMEDN